MLFSVLKRTNSHCWWELWKIWNIDMEKQGQQLLLRANQRKSDFRSIYCIYPIHWLCVAPCRNSLIRLTCWLLPQGIIFLLSPASIPVLPWDVGMGLWWGLRDRQTSCGNRSVLQGQDWGITGFMAQTRSFSSHHCSITNTPSQSL